MISIITRCRNRLEYTTQVLDAVKRNTVMPYEHIIVDNASTDGTKEWFTWMAEHTSWYSNLRYIRMNENHGDWGGMLIGAEHSKGEFIVQLDNDIIPCMNWITHLHTALTNSHYRVMMLKRANVFGKWILQPLSPVKVIEGMSISRVERAVACYMMSREDFSECAKRIPESKGTKSKYIMAGLTRGWEGLTIGKILDKTCYELEADEEMIESKTDQRTKYPPMIKGLPNPVIWEKV